MNILKNILFPTDFGPAYKSDLENAIKIAEKFESKLIVIHVLPIYSAWDSFLIKLKQKIDEKMAETSEYISQNSKISFETKIIFGTYAKKIVETANEEKVNLILLGAGNQKNENSKLGSNSEKIIRSSSIPVWVMENQWPFSLETILCPVDFSETSKKALDNAIHLARRFNSKLIVLHVTQTLNQEYRDMDIDFESEKTSYENQDAKEFLEFLKSFNFTELDMEHRIRIGEPHSVINDIIKTDIVDLLIMGSHGRQGLKRFFLGSVTEKVIRNVPCSFITLKSKDMIHLELAEDIKTIESMYQYAVDLAKDGYLEEAIDQLDNCINLNEYYIKAWRGKSEIYERLGNEEMSKICDETADRIQKSIWEKQIEADLRRQHSMFK